jgi:hypothetical protein
MGNGGKRESGRGQRMKMDNTCARVMTRRCWLVAELGLLFFVPLVSIASPLSTSKATEVCPALAPSRWPTTAPVEEDVPPISELPTDIMDEPAPTITESM